MISKTLFPLVRFNLAPAGICFLVLAVSSSLTGCIFRDRSEDYQRTGSIKPITVPEGVTSVPMEPLYPIPDVQEQSAAFYDIRTDGFVVPRPEQMSAEGEKSKIKIQKVGDVRWILAEAPTSQIWPLTQSFLSRAGINVAQSTPVTGLIQTDWVVFKADPNSRNQFRIRIEKGLRPETTEIHVLQHQVEGESATFDSWPEKSTNPERESWLLDELANALAGDIDNKAASLLGQAVGGDVKAELFMDGTEPALRLRLPRSRAWATMAHSLTREGFIPWDESSEKGVFYAQFRDESKKRNWFIRLFTFEPAAATKEAPHSLTEVLTHLSPREEVRRLFGEVDGVAFAEPLEKSYGYLVVLYPQGSDYIVKLRNARGERIDLADNKRMLAVIRRNLI
jgi:outer membrane protein assembly factor BamC